MAPPYRALPAAASRACISGQPAKRMLAQRRATWQGAAMARTSSMGGGALIAAGAILGTVLGVVAWQPTLGFLAGIGLGIAAALLIWWRGR